MNKREKAREQRAMDASMRKDILLILLERIPPPGMFVAKRKTLRSLMKPQRQVWPA
jgi:hypothetical protein